MYIHLFSVCGFASEVAAEWPSINKEVARDDTDILLLGEDIEASGLTGTRSTHESRQCPGLDITVNLVEESTSSTGDGDSVIDAFPGESPLVSKGSLLPGL